MQSARSPVQYLGRPNVFPHSICRLQRPPTTQRAFIRTLATTTNHVTTQHARPTPPQNTLSLPSRLRPLRSQHIHPPPRRLKSHYTHPQQTPPPPHSPLLTRLAALRKTNPISLLLASSTILIFIGTLAWISLYYYPVYILGAYASFPEPVAKKLRRAVYYTDVDVRPKEAGKYYAEAYAAAQECGMDPLGEPVLGIRVAGGRMLWKVGAGGEAIRILEGVRGDVVGFVDGDAGDCGGGRGSGSITGGGGDMVYIPPKEVQEMEAEERQKWEWARKTKALRVAVRVSVVLGDWYADQRVGDTALAEERLVWGVTRALRERERRARQGEDQGDWFGEEELGGALESLADHYASKGLHYLSTPLYLQAVPTCTTPCHQVVLMNNLATALLLQNPGQTQQGPGATAADQIGSATQWAKKALEISKEIKGEKRTSECDEAQAVATVNLGELASLEGRSLDAKQYFEDGKRLCKRVGLRDGVQKAEAGLKSLSM